MIKEFKFLLIRNLKSLILFSSSHNLNCHLTFPFQQFRHHHFIKFYYRSFLLTQIILPYPTIILISIFIKYWSFYQESLHFLEIIAMIAIFKTNPVITQKFISIAIVDQSGDHLYQSLPVHSPRNALPIFKRK